MLPKHQWLKRDFYLHLAIAIAVAIQLLSSVLFGLPGPWFLVHKVFGILAFILILAFLVSRLINPSPSKWANLFPWNTPQGRECIIADMVCLCHGKLPVRRGGGLAGMVQGLGVLLILAMGALGTVWYILIYFKLVGRDVTSALIHLHAQLAVLVWVYFIAHACMAILHRLFPEKWQKNMEYRGH